jgi:hypothetical protein
MFGQHFSVTTRDILVALVQFLAIKELIVANMCSGSCCGYVFKKSRCCGWLPLVLLLLYKK